MKRSCGNIDITDVKTIEPWVTECVLRHRKRYDFRKLIRRTLGISKSALSKALESNNYAIFLQASTLIAEEASRRIKEHNLDLPPVTYKQQLDASSGKVRLIGNESAMQQVFDYIAVYSCEDIWHRRIVPQQIAGIKDRGAIYGISMIQHYVDKDNSAIRYAKAHHIRYQSKCKYHTKLDVTQCYPSLRVSRFMSLFERDCKNKNILWLWEQLLNSHSVGKYYGFMIGALCSQWACQYMISFIYRHANSLHSKRRDKKTKWLSHVVIQMDDILLISPNRKNLKKAVFSIVDYAKINLGLRIKNTWQVQDFTRTPIDIVGYKIHRNGGISVRDRIFLRLRRLCLRVLRRNKITIEQAERLTAYKGYFQDNSKHKATKQGKHSDAYNISHKLDLYKLFREAQKLVSRCNKGGLLHYGYCLLYGKTGNSYVYVTA